MALIPESWLKAAIKKASTRGFRNFLLNKDSRSVETDALISSIRWSEASPVNANTLLAASSSFLNRTSHLGVSGVNSIKVEKISDGIATTPSIQRQSLV